MDMTKTGNSSKKKKKAKSSTKKCPHCFIMEAEMKRLYETLADKDLMIAKLMEVAASHADLIQRTTDYSAKISKICRRNDA